MTDRRWQREGVDPVTSEWWWYAARAAGMLAWVLSTMSVVFGLLLASPSLRRRATEAAVADLHRFLGGLATVFLGVHVLAVAGDGRDGVGILDVLVPFRADSDRLVLACGWFAAVALLVVEATSLLRSRVGEVRWRYAHYAGFAVFVLSTVHGLGAGTDTEHPAVWWTGAVAAAAVAGLVLARIFLNGSPLRDLAVDDHPDPVALEVQLVRPDRPGPELLERTLEGLRKLEDAPRVPVTAAFDDDAFAVPPPVTAVPEPRPLRPTQVVSGSLLGEPPTDTPRPTPAAASERPATAPQSGPAPLPVRSPRRLARTTSAAESLDGWRPARATDAVPVAPPAPPTEVDPRTGEPDPQAYRKWLREWLAYVESQA